MLWGAYNYGVAMPNLSMNKNILIFSIPAVILGLYYLSSTGSKNQDTDRPHPDTNEGNKSTLAKKTAIKTDSVMSAINWMRGTKEHECGLWIYRDVPTYMASFLPGLVLSYGIDYMQRNLIYKTSLGKNPKRMLQKSIDGASDHSEHLKLHTKEGEFLEGAESRWIDIEDGNKFHALYKAPQEGNSNVVILSHGMYKNWLEEFRINTLKEVADKGYGILAISHLGFDPNPASGACEANFQKVCKATAGYVTENLDNSFQYSTFGESLGCYSALNIAVEMTKIGKPPKDVIIVNGFTSMWDMIILNFPQLTPYRQYFTEHLDNLALVKQLDTNETTLNMIVSKQDNTVHCSHSDSIAQIAEAKGLKVNRVDEDADHTTWQARNISRLISNESRMTL